mgnify:FL=1
MARPTEGILLDESHRDHHIDGKVERAEWFSKDEIQNIKVFPQRLQNTFWQNIDQFLQEENPFICVINSLSKSNLNNKSSDNQYHS